MSNDVWGTPVVSGDLLYVTSFEIHALDVGNGRRQFKTRDVAWAMAVEGGRIHASDGPSLYALDAAGGAEQWRVRTDAWVYALKADRGTVLTATRGGGVQGWEASNGDKLWEITGAQSDFETAEAAPVIHDGTVYVWQDARLRALDARTGLERWSYPIGDAASPAAPAKPRVRVIPAPRARASAAVTRRCSRCVRTTRARRRTRSTCGSSTPAATPWTRPRRPRSSTSARRTPSPCGWTPPARCPGSSAAK
ncbi:PQQ-binding-like beta-propeller repeat protein (Fragment) OS=Streptomyces cyaneofuscatus OX=66883 GN=G3I52_17135 PE=4 SV=1 [Streptomyces cyaneofuscatus]